MAVASAYCAVDDVAVVVAKALPVGSSHDSPAVRDVPPGRDRDVVDAQRAGLGIRQVFGWYLQADFG
jgi:hypothetical protein